MANKIVKYLKPDDKELPEYFFGHRKLLGIDSHPFGITEFNVLAFEGKESDSALWRNYKISGGSLAVAGNTDFVWTGFQKGDYTLSDIMQFYRELGLSLTAFIDAFAAIYYMEKDKEFFKKSLEKLKKIDTFDLATQEILRVIFLAHMNGVGDALIYEYKKSTKEIIAEKFGNDTWLKFIEELKQNHNNDD